MPSSFEVSAASSARFAGIRRRRRADAELQQLSVRAVAGVELLAVVAPSRFDALPEVLELALGGLARSGTRVSPVDVGRLGPAGRRLLRAELVISRLRRATKSSAVSFGAAVAASTCRGFAAAGDCR